MGDLIPESELERRRRNKRIAEFDETIRIWGEKLALAERMIRETNEAKDRFMTSQPTTLVVL